MMRYFLAGCCVLALAMYSVGRADEPAPPGKLITLEVVVADVPNGAAAAPTAAAILEMEKAGKLSGCSRFRLTGLENQETSIQFGEHVPIVAGRTIRGGGGGPGGAGGFPGVASFTQVAVGTMVETVSRVESAEAVVISLKLQRSSVTPAPPAAEPADPNTPPQGTMTLNIQATVRAKPGEPLLVTGRQLSSGKETTQTWVVVTASVGAGAAPEKKAAAVLDGDQLKIVQLKHAAAPALANVLVGVFQREPLRIAVDERTNSLLLRGSPASLEIVLALITRLDEA